MKGFNPPVTPAKIVEDNWRFSIPIYQRLFVWKSEQIDRLLDDLWAASQAKDQNNETPPYYIGVITTVEHCDSKNGRVFSVVDGQQRLTFLLLFFCECLARGEDPTSILQQNFVFSEQNLRIKFLGRDNDEQDILNYASEQKGWSKVTNLNFRQFHERMEIFRKKHQDDWECQKRQFIEYVFEKTSFLVNELAGYSNADLNLYFEKMNSTGRQLSPLDQLKGCFANHASEWNDCFNFEMTRKESETKRKGQSNEGEGAQPANVPQQFNDGNINSLDDIVNWKKEIEKEPKQTQESSYYSRLLIRPEVLALHALRLTMNRRKEKINPGNTISLSARHLLDTFKPLTGLDVSSDERAKFGEEFINQLKTYRDWMDNNIVFLRGEVEEDGEDESDSLGLKYSFREASSKYACNGQQHENRKMLQLQSMLYVSSGESQEWILEAYEACKKGDDNPQALSFDLLRTIALNRWADIKKNDYRTIDELSYSPGMNRIAFWMLDYLLWEKVYDAAFPKDDGISSCDPLLKGLEQAQLEAIKRYRFTQNRSVEHLHPQNPPSESVEWKNAGIVRNSFGNLCMISQSANSSLSNDPVDVKFAKIRYALQGHPLQSIKLMLMFADCHGKDSEWSPTRAKEHGEEMLRVLGFSEEDIQRQSRNQSGVHNIAEGKCES